MGNGSGYLWVMEKIRLRIKNNNKIIFKQSGKKYKTFDVGCIVK